MENTSIYGNLTLSTQCQLLTILEQKAFENIVGKGENAGNQHFLLFPTVFYPSHDKLEIFESLFCRLQMLWILTSVKFCCLEKG